MSRFDLRTETVHAEWWEDGETVTLKELTHGEQHAINRRILGRQQINVGKKSAGMQMELGNSMDAQEAILLAHIVSWTFTDSKGVLVPVTAENVNRLPQRDTDFILEEIDRLTPSRDDHFPSGSGDGSANGEG
jgi:hypothetical protein